MKNVKVEKKMCKISEKSFGVTLVKRIEVKSNWEKKKGKSKKETGEKGEK